MSVQEFKQSLLNSKGKFTPFNTFFDILDIVFEQGKKRSNSDRKTIGEAIIFSGSELQKLYISSRKEIFDENEMNLAIEEINLLLRHGNEYKNRSKGWAKG
jgi:hypothetical protein